MSFGALPRTRRNERGIALKDLALGAGLSLPSLSRIERDRENPPGNEIIMKLAEIIGIPADDLFVQAQLPDQRQRPDPVFVAYRRPGGGR